MQKNKRETHEGTCVGQSVGVCGGSVELVKRKRETLEGTCVGQCIGSGRFGSIKLDSRGKPDGGRALELVENSNEEVSFGEENWEMISGDTLGDDEGFGLVVMTTLGSWMAWRSLA
jgi:hypothetical protein